MPSRADLAKIHIAKKELGLPDNVYRDILKTHFNRNSAAKLSPVQAGRLINHFKKLGWKPKQAKLPGMNVPNDGQSKKIQALWINMYKEGFIKNGSEQTMMAFVKRITKRDQLKWCSTKDKSKIIEALKAIGKREGVNLA